MGSLLAKPETSKVVERQAYHYFTAGMCSMNGFRMAMEDAHCMHTSRPEIGNPHSTFGIFDGHVNSSCAEFVAERIPKAVERLPRPLCKTSLEGTFYDIDAAYLDDDRDGGSTATMAIIEPITSASFSCTICNTGDSRILVIRKGEIFFQTKDHKPTLPEEEARIEAAGGRVELERVNGDLSLSRAFGDGRYKMGQTTPDKQMVTVKPQIDTIELLPDDILVLSCDGVYEGDFSATQVKDFVLGAMTEKTFSGDLAVISAMVCDESVKRGSKDNITCMIVHIAPANPIEQFERFGKQSFVPGMPPLVPSDKPARDQFEVMCRMGGMNVAQALQKRFELLQNRTALLPPRFTDLESHAFDISSEEDLAAETMFFGEGPPLETSDEDKGMWFQNLWDPNGSKSPTGSTSTKSPDSEMS